MTKKNKGKGWKIALGILLFLLVLVVGMGVLLSDDEIGVKTEVSQPSKTLNAKIQFNGTQFIITNNDNYDWTSVKFKVNSGIISDGYTLKCPRIVAGTTYTVGAMQFTKSDGTRLNPFTTKPKSIFIFADQGDRDLYWE